MSPDPSPIFRSPLVVVDTETTGLPHDPDARPWEIAAVLLDRSGREVDHIEALGRPAVWRPDMARVVGLGGYRAEDLLAQPPLADLIPRVLAWIQDAIQDGARLTAYNVPFDRGMLARVGIEVRVEDWAPCVMARAGGLPLWSAAQVHRVPQQLPAHRALADARTAGLVAVAVQRRAMAEVAAQAQQAPLFGRG